ncbi:MAG: hypothetical protein ACK5CA_08230 [Cyanobacteriota bacterium]|jgi:hypothetical protein
MFTVASSAHKSLHTLTTAALLGVFALTAAAPVAAKPVTRPLGSYRSYNRVGQTAPAPTVFTGSLPAGTWIPLADPSGQSLEVQKGQSLSLTLQTAAPIRDGQGRVLIPRGSEVLGQLRPTSNGVQFVAQQIYLPNGQWAPLNATSRELTDFSQTTPKASAADVVKGTLAGAGAATVLAGVTGDRRIEALEVLGGAAFGALAGWGLPAAGIIGGDSKGVLTIDPARDLTLTLQSPLTLNGAQETYRYTPSARY